MQWEQFAGSAQTDEQLERLADEATRRLVLVRAFLLSHASCIVPHAALMIAACACLWPALLWPALTHVCRLTRGPCCTVCVVVQAQSKMDLRPSAVSEAVSLTHGSNVVVAGNLARALRRRKKGDSEQVRTAAPSA